MVDKTLWYVVQEDTDLYNVFSSDMFDYNGRYIENKEYNLKDMDIIATFRGPLAMENAFDYVEKLNG